MSKWSNVSTNKVLCNLWIKISYIISDYLVKQAGFTEVTAVNSHTPSLQTAASEITRSWNCWDQHPTTGDKANSKKKETRKNSTREKRD